jgi:hypothetical protein
MFDLLDFLKRLQESGQAPSGIIGTAQEAPAPAQEEQKPGGLLSQFLPEDPDKREAVAMALLNGGAGMMAAGGPSLTPQNFLGAVGQGLGAGAQGYAQARKDGAENAHSRASANSEKFKLQQAQESSDRNSALMEKLKEVGPEGFSTEQLWEIMKNAALNGDDTTFRQVQEQIQKRDQVAATNGQVYQDGILTVAPGYGESLNETERQKSAGRVEGEELFMKTDDIREFEYGQENPEFKTSQEDKRDAGRQANRLQKIGAYIDPKTNRRFNAYFDSATGKTNYMDASNNPVDDPEVIDRMVEDTPGRTKANMSDPVVKKEREAEAALASAAGRSQQAIGTIDRMQELGKDINENSWIGTGGYNDTAKVLDSILPFDNFYGSERQELDNLMQEQVKTEIDSMRGLGAMSDRDLALIEKRVLSGDLNPAALKEIGDRLRKIANYNASKYEAWKASGQTDDFQNWAYSFDKDNYSKFMGDGGSDESDIPKVSTQAEREKLPSNVEFYIAPDGSKRRNPKFAPSNLL